MLYYKIYVNLIDFMDFSLCFQIMGIRISLSQLIKSPLLVIFVNERRGCYISRENPI